MSTTYGPSAIDPAEWTCMGIYYQGHSEAMHEAYAYDVADLFDNLGFDLWVFDATSDGTINPRINVHANGGCASCGSHYAHGVVFRRGTDEYIAVGHICGQDFGLPTLASKNRKKAEKEAKRIKNWKAGEDFAHEHELVPIFALVDDLWADQLNAVQSMLGQLHKKGELSEKQVAYLRLIQKWHEERKVKEAEKVADKEPVPISENRITITGTVISTRWDDTDFGSVCKMLVEDDRGFRVWGNRPGSLEAKETGNYEEWGQPIYSENAEKGSRVKFNARVEQSAKDEYFGFYKRPTKAEFIELEEAS